MTSIGVVGAGAAAAAACHVVDETLDADVTVLEKSGGLCGRAATRRHGDVTYDYGANYLKADDQRVVDLVHEFDDGLAEVAGDIGVFDKEGTVSEGRDEQERKFTYRSGLTRLAKHLFGATDATVHRRTRVDRVVHDDDRWILVDADGERWGPFDALFVNPPAPQTAALVETADWDADARETLVDALRDVEFRTIWTAVLGYDFELDWPHYALVNTDTDHAVGWVAREECKPGHVPDGESVLVVQATHEWSVEQYDADPAANVAALAAHVASIVDDDRLTNPAWTDHHGWRHALPETEVRADALAAAETDGWYCIGDWVAGEARLHAAVRNGLETGARLADSY